MDFSGILTRWYESSKRELPWRNTRDPYRIWLSEIILQQTRVDQGLSYYGRFLEAFPSVNELAAASQEQVLKLWQGLGYYSRARNLHETARYIVATSNGSFPGSYNELRKLKGIGDYTAAAVASFAFGEKKAVVDGNVYRVLSRIFGVHTPIDTSAGKTQFQELADTLTGDDPAAHNQAIMEFGALVCRPANPDCGACPFSKFCIASTEGKVAVLPVKSKKTTVKARHLNYLVLNYNESIILTKREKNDIWKGLFDMPLIETPLPADEPSVLINSTVFREFDILRPVFSGKSATYRHQLTHRELHAVFWEFRLALPIPGSYNTTALDGNCEYPVPRLIDKFLSQKKTMLKKS